MAADNRCVDGDVTRFQPGDTVRVVCADGEPIAARVVAHDGDRLILDLQGAAQPAQPASRRAAPRYPAELPCVAVLPEGGRLPARTHDLSEFGVALVLTRAPRSGWFWVEFGREQPLRVRAEVLGVDDTLFGYVHHCRFQFDTPETRRAVAALVAACRERFAAGQRSVALRRLGPLRPGR